MSGNKRIFNNRKIKCVHPGVISGVLVTLALSQASYSNEFSMSQQKAGNNVSNSHSLSVRAKTSEIAMFIQHGKSHKPSTGKKGKKA